MSRTSLATSESWKDYAGMWNPAVQAWIAPLGQSKCHAPRIVQCPPIQQSLTPALRKLEYNFRLVPGSVIFGVAASENDSFTMQLTDVGLGHSLFQEPAGPDVFSIDGHQFGMLADFFLLPCPWPVTGEGMFTLEAWNNDDNPARFIFQLLVAEVTECSVRG